MSTPASPYAYIAAGCHQIAFVVKDIHGADRFFVEKMGVPRFFHLPDIENLDKVYRGKPGEFRMHVAIGYAGDSQIELIEHISGGSIYKEFLDRTGGGLHHLAFLVPDHEKAVADLSANGFSVIQSGRFGWTKYASFDTEAAIGAVMELLTLDDDARALIARIKSGDF